MGEYILLTGILDLYSICKIILNFLPLIVITFTNNPKNSGRIKILVSLPHLLYPPVLSATPSVHKHSCGVPWSFWGAILRVRSVLTIVGVHLPGHCFLWKERLQSPSVVQEQPQDCPQGLPALMPPGPQWRMQLLLGPGGGPWALME